MRPGLFLMIKFSMEVRREISDGIVPWRLAPSVRAGTRKRVNSEFGWTAAQIESHYSDFE